MKLVLLPGMDGTGELFKSFLLHYQGPSLVIPLPVEGGQTHAELAAYIEKILPDEEIVILAESYSGAIVPYLLSNGANKIKGVVFVASFLSTPHKNLIGVTKYLPIHFLNSLPFASLVHKALFLGWSISFEMLRDFVRVLRSVPEALLKQRLRELKKLELPSATFGLPTAYVRATQDILVRAYKYKELKKIFINSRYYEIKAPHFVLQSKPKETAELIESAIKDMRIA